MTPKAIDSLIETAPISVVLQDGSSDLELPLNETGVDEPLAEGPVSMWDRFLSIFDRLLDVDKRPADKADDEHFRSWGP